MKKTPYSRLSLFVILVFFANTIGPFPQAQANEFRLPAPGVRVNLSPEYNPPILKGLKVHPDDPFRFDFILDQGDLQNSSIMASSLKTEATRLIKYFLASLTIPEKDLWVNLSPYEKDRIIPQSFGQTEMGRDLLAEDYMLKQITASLVYPEDEIGKKFWKRIYEKAYKKFGTTNIPVNTFNKVWIVPEKAVVYENAQAGTAYVVESKLKVMLEQDYLALEKNQRQPDTLSSQIVREIVIPELTKEVNENKNFAQLRQVYNSLILATWYKKKIKDSILAQVYEDKKKVAGVGYKNSSPEGIYQRYLQAFKKGVYNYIKEDIDPVTQERTPRKYFSGGVNFFGKLEMAKTFDPAMIPISSERSVIVRSDFAMFHNPLHDELNEVIQRWVKGSQEGIGITASDGTNFEFKHQEKEATKIQRHIIDVFLDGRRIGYIHFKVTRNLKRNYALMDTEFLSHDWVVRPQSKYAIFVDPEFTKAFQGRYKGIGRSLLGLAERLSYFEGAEQFYAQEVGRLNFDRFYIRLGYRDAELGQNYDFHQTVVKDLEEPSFSRIAIEQTSSPAQVVPELALETNQAMQGDVSEAYVDESIAAKSFASRLEGRIIEDKEHVRYIVITKPGIGRIRINLIRETDNKRFWNETYPLLEFKVDPSGNVSTVNINVINKYLEDGNKLADRGLAKQLYQLLWETMPDGAGIDELLTNRESLNFLREHCNANEEGIFFEETPGAKPLRIVDQGPVMEGQITLEDVLSKTLMGHLFKQASFMDISFSFKVDQGKETPRITGEKALRRFLGERIERPLSFDTPAIYLNARKSLPVGQGSGRNGAGNHAMVTVPSTIKDFYEIAEKIQRSPVLELANFVVSSRQGTINLIDTYEHLLGELDGVINSQFLNTFKGNLEILRNKFMSVPIKKGSPFSEGDEELAQQTINAYKKAITNFSEALEETSIFQGALNKLSIPQEELASLKVQGILDGISRTGRNMYRLVEHFSLITAGNPWGIISPSLDLNKFLKEAVERERNYIPEQMRQVRISFALDEQVPTIIVDKTRLMMGFREVIRNAVYATVRSVGRGMFTTFRDRSNVLISTKYVPEENLIQVTITDNGIGMDEEGIRNMSLYGISASDRNNKVYFGGHGIGFPGMLFTISEYGGKVTVESSKDKGTEITFSLPVGLPQWDQAMADAAYKRPADTYNLYEGMDPKKILISQLHNETYVGDQVIATGIVDLVRARFPKAEIYVLVRSPDVYKGFTKDPQVHVMDAKQLGLQNKIGESEGVLKFINGQDFDVVYSLNRIFGEGNDDFYAQIKTPLFISTGKYRKSVKKENFSQQGIVSVGDNRVNWYDAYKKIFENWGLIDKASDYASKWEVIDEEKDQAREILKANGVTDEKKEIIFLNAGASAESKEMSAGEWKEFLYRLSSHIDLRDYYFVIDQGADRNQPLAKEIADSLREVCLKQYGETSLPYDPLLPRSNLRIMAAVISLSNAVLTIDTSVGHIAPALRIPTFVIFPEGDQSIVLADWKAPSAVAVNFRAEGKDGGNNMLEVVESFSHFIRDKAMSPEAVYELIKKSNSRIPHPERSTRGTYFQVFLYPKLGIVEKRANKRSVLESVMLAKDRLGGLVADFMVVKEGEEQIIIQESAPSLQSVLEQKIKEKDDAAVENLLEQFFKMNQEIIRRGVINWDPTLENFGVREDGKVILIDIGGLSDLLDPDLEENLSSEESSDISYFMYRLKIGVPSDILQRFSKKVDNHGFGDGGKIYEQVKQAIRPENRVMDHFRPVDDGRLIVRLLKDLAMALKPIVDEPPSPGDLFSRYVIDAVKGRISGLNVKTGEIFYDPDTRRPLAKDEHQRIFTFSDKGRKDLFYLNIKLKGNNISSFVLSFPKGSKESLGTILEPFKWSSGNFMIILLLAVKKFITKDNKDERIETFETLDRVSRSTVFFKKLFEKYGASFSLITIGDKPAFRAELNSDFWDALEAAQKAFPRSGNETKAMITQRGGIDLTSTRMHVETNTSDMGGIRFHLDPAMLAQLRNAPGFVPVIISVEAVTDLRGFLMNK